MSQNFADLHWTQEIQDIKYFFCLLVRAEDAEPPSVRPHISALWALLRILLARIVLNAFAHIVQRTVYYSAFAHCTSFCEDLNMLTMTNRYYHKAYGREVPGDHHQVFAAQWRSAVSPTTILMVFMVTDPRVIGRQAKGAKYFCNLQCAAFYTILRHNVAVVVRLSVEWCCFTWGNVWNRSGFVFPRLPSQFRFSTSP